MSDSRILTARCGQCGTKLQVKTQAVEKCVPCPKCKSPVTATQAEGSPPKIMSGASGDAFSCPNCASPLDTNPNAIGRTATCPDCRRRVRVPAPAEPSHPTPDRPKAAFAMSVGLVGFALVMLSFVTLWTLKPIRGQSFARILDIALGDLIGTNALFSGSMAAGFITALAGILGCVGFVMCIAGAVKKSATAFGLFGVFAFLAKFGIILMYR